jgi:hypothetical protein
MPAATSRGKTEPLQAGPMVQTILVRRCFGKMVIPPAPAELWVKIDRPMVHFTHPTDQNNEAKKLSLGALTNYYLKLTD